LNCFWLRLLEIILGGIFVYAGLLKHLHAEEFAEAVAAYQLLPVSLVGLVAAALPWVEIAAGLFLAVGIKKRSCLLLLGAMIGGFLLVLFITAGRGLKIDCGCGLFFARQVGLGVILEDTLLLAWTAAMFKGEINAGEQATEWHGFLKSGTENPKPKT
jgi:putative oxidoreductase